MKTNGCVKIKTGTEKMGAVRSNVQIHRIIESCYELCSGREKSLLLSRVYVN